MKMTQDEFKTLLEFTTWCIGSGITITIEPEFYRSYDGIPVYNGFLLILHHDDKRRSFRIHDMQQMLMMLGDPAQRQQIYGDFFCPPMREIKVDEGE